MNKKLALSLLVCTLGAAQVTRADAQVAKKTNPKIAFINVPELMGNSDIGIESTAVLEKEHKTLTDMLTKMQKDLSTKIADFSNPDKAAAMSDGARRATEKQLTQLKVDLEFEAKKGKEQIERSMQTITSKVYKEAEAAAKSYAEKFGFDVVKDSISGRVVYLRSEKDCTKDVLDIMNKRTKTTGKTGSKKRA